MNPRKGVPPLTRTEMTFLVTYATCTEALCLVPNKFVKCIPGQHPSQRCVDSSMPCTKLFYHGLQNKQSVDTD